MVRYIRTVRWSTTLLPLVAITLLLSLIVSHAHGDALAIISHYNGSSARFDVISNDHGPLAVVSRWNAPGVISS